MALPTQPVTCRFYDQSGNPAAGARVVFRLTVSEIYDGFVAPELVEATADAAGQCVVQLFPNALGSQASQYEVRAWNEDDGAKILDAFCSVPDTPCLLHEIVNLEPYPAVDQALQALISAQAALSSVTAQRVLAEAAASTAQVDADAAQSAAASAADSALAAQTSGSAVALSAALALSTGAEMVGVIQAGTEAVGRTVEDELRDSIKAVQYGVSPAATASFNRTKLQEAIDDATASGKTLEFSFPSDITVDETIFVYSNTKIINTGIGGIVRTTLTPDADGKIAVLSVGDTSAFKSNLQIKGGLKIQFSAALGPANTRGSNTVCFYAGNLYDAHLEVRCMYAEYAWQGKSNFNITGKLDSEWCHKGLFLDPSVAGSAGGTCTSFDLRVNMDFTIFPFVLKNVVYSRFTGFVEAIRKTYAHYAADETAVIFTTEGCSGVDFSGIGCEAFQGMLAYNKTTPSYVKYSLFVDMTNADHFEHDAARTNNIPYAQQAFISLQTVGTFDFDQTVISGGSVTVSTSGSYLIRRSSDDSTLTINGGYIEPGANYTFADRTQGIRSNGSRFYSAYRYTNTETRIKLDSGLVWIDVTGLVTDASGEFTVAPSGIKQILMCEAKIVRTVTDPNNFAVLKSKNSAVSWTFKTGLAAGYGADVKVLAIES